METWPCDLSTRDFWNEIGGFGLEMPDAACYRGYRLGRRHVTCSGPAKKNENPWAVVGHPIGCSTTPVQFLVAP